MGFFDKMKSMVGVGNPDLKIEVSTTNYAIDSNIVGKVLLTAKDRSTPVKNIVVYVRHYFTEKNGENKIFPKNEKIAEIIIQTNDEVVNPGETLQRDFELRFNKINFERANSKFCLEAFADIPGLDSKDKIEITIAESPFFSAEEPSELVEQQKELTTSIDTNWRERINTIHAFLEEKEFKIDTFEVGEPKTSEEIEQAFVKQGDIPDELIHIYKQMDGAHVSAYKDDYHVFFFLPKLEDVTSYDNFAGWDDEITELDFVIDVASTDAPNCSIIKAGETTITLDKESKLSKSALSINQYLDLKFKALLNMNFFAALLTEITGEQYTTAPDDFYDFMYEFCPDEVMHSPFFTNHLITE